MQDKIAFISGHRDITDEEFTSNYTSVIIQHVRNSGWFVIGDCDGCDKKAAELLGRLIAISPYEIHLTIYHMKDSPRFIVPMPATPGNLNSTIDYIGGFESDIERDSAMTKNSDVDIAFIRDKSKWKSGTAQNLLRRHTMKNA